MKAAVLSDIHGNFPALSAVLNDIHDVDVVFICGDLVGYYPDANEVCDALRSLNPTAVWGNHDAFITGKLSFDQNKDKFYKIKYTRDTLTRDNFSWLERLPREINDEYAGVKIKMRHANPWDDETYLYPDSKKLSDIFLHQDELLFLGHTHHPMWVKSGEGWILNPGSVGQPRDWNPQASYAIFNFIDRKVEFRRVVYNVKAYQQRLLNMGWESPVVDILSRTKDHQSE